MELYKYSMTCTKTRKIPHLAPEVLEAATGSLEGALALASLVSRTRSLGLGLAGGVARWAEVKVTGFRGDSRVALLGRLWFSSKIAGHSRDIKGH